MLENLSMVLVPMCEEGYEEEYEIGFAYLFAYFKYPISYLNLELKSLYTIYKNNLLLRTNTTCLLVPTAQRFFGESVTINSLQGLDVEENIKNGSLQKYSLVNGNSFVAV